MACYFYNTDAKSLGGEVRFPILIKGRFAATGGDRSYGEQLSPLREGDTLLMYKNRTGVVAVGVVLEPWDGKGHEAPLYYDPGNPIEWPQGSREYRIGVEWSTVLQPITVQVLRQRLGYERRWSPSKAIMPTKRTAEIKELIDEYLLRPDAAAIIAEASGPFGGGESEHHKALKHFIANNPGAIGLRFVSPGLTEFALPSGDCLDVSFEDDLLWVAVEAKSAISSCGDIARGLFQCVKYEAVMDAVLRVTGRRQKAGALLVLEGRLPKPLVRLKDELGIKVIEGVAPDNR